MRRIDQHSFSRGHLEQLGVEITGIIEEAAVYVRDAILRGACAVVEFNKVEAFLWDLG